MTVKKVLIQVGDDGMPVAPCGFALWEGARFLGLKPMTLHMPDQLELRLFPQDRDVLVHGWVSTVHAALTRIGGVSIPPPLDYPGELAPFVGRDIRCSTLGEVHKAFSADDRPVFIKPVECKLFVGHTIERFRDLVETANLPPETPVWVSGIVDFVSEYRCFVHEGALIGARQYTGTIWAVPDRNTVMAMIRSYRAAPIGYALDVGVTRDGRTLLVEANDGYALGNQGLAPLPYTELVVARWEQLCQR